MEDEAEVQLLQQHLLKTRQISQRMTSILSKFDHRLVKLEKSVTPLHESSQALTRRINNINATLRCIDKLSGQEENLAVEESLILRGPRPEDLKLYTDAIERLNANIAFGASDQAVTENARLVETGAKKLAQLYTKLVAEASSGSPPVNISAPTTTYPSSVPQLQASAPFSLQIISTLTPLVSSLRKLPLPSTHPSHPASASIFATLKDAQRGYADMRGSWGKKCLEGGGWRIIERLETPTGVDTEQTGGAESFVGWVKELIEVCNAEYSHLTSLAPIPAPVSSLTQTYGTLLSPILSLFTTNFTALTSLIKKDLPKHTFLALSTYSLLQGLQSGWEDVITQRLEDREGSELRDGLSTLHGICLRSFPEVLVDVQMAAMGPPGEVGTSVAPITNQIVKYLNQLPEVLPAVFASLLALGDGNWKMGQGVGKGGKVAGTTDEGELLENYIYDIVSALFTSLTSLSRTHRRPSLASIFLLNNVSFLRLHLVAIPQSTIDEHLSKATMDSLNSAFRSAKADYFSSNFTPLVQCLGDDPNPSKGVVGGLGGGAKSQLKEKWMKFWDALDELVERHRYARVMSDDIEGRELLSDEAVRLTVPSLKSFSVKNRDKEFTKNLSKYIKMTPAEVEQAIRDMYGTGRA